MTDLAFRSLVHDDLLLLYNWLARPAVARWYAPAPRSFAEIAAKYAPRTEPGDPVKAFIVQVDGRDAGYAQGYFLSAFPDYAQRCAAGSGDFGIDCFLGEPFLIGRGIGAEAIRRFAHDIGFARYGADACVAGVPEGNAAALAAFRRAGFSGSATTTNERGETECLLRLPCLPGGFRVTPIAPGDERTCAAFHRDMYAVAFGTDAGLEEEMGPGDARYLAQLSRRIADFPEGMVHLRHGEAIVGQLEMKRLADEPRMGYVSMLYVVPDHRDHGCGALLHGHAARVARRHGMEALRLSVSLTNEAALRFYANLGYRRVGERPNVRPMAILELAIA